MNWARCVFFLPSELPFLLHWASARILHIPPVVQRSIIKPCLKQAALRPFQMENTQNHLAWCHGIQGHTSGTGHNTVFPQVCEHSN